MSGYNLPPLLQRWGVPATVGVLLIALWALILLVSMVQKQRLLDEGGRELAQLNSAVAQHAAGLLRDVETSMHVVDLWLQANPRINPRTDRRFAELMEELRSASDGLAELRLVAGDGAVLAFPPRPSVDVSDRPYFQAQQKGGARELYIGDPVVSRITGKWSIPLSWRLEKPVAGMQMVVAAIQLDKLMALHEQMRLKPNGAISLARLDGMVLARTPFDPKFIGRNLGDMPNFKSEFAVKERGILLSMGPLTGVPRMMSYERLNGYPIVATVSRAQADMLAMFEARRNMLWAVAAVLTAFALGFTWFLVRSQRALRVAQENLMRLEATDSLTGVMSRRAFIDRAHYEFSRARRYGRPTAVLVLDLDHFKRVNDNYGHALGDIVLRECASAWKGVLREQDLIGRIGGEEFCAVLPETPLNSALLAAERLRASLARLQFSGKSQAFKVTVSVGLAMVGQSDEDFARTLERADHALYLAKERGRDRVETLEAAQLSTVAAQPGLV